MKQSQKIEQEKRGEAKEIQTTDMQMALVSF